MQSVLCTPYISRRHSARAICSCAISPSAFLLLLENFQFGTMGNEFRLQFNCENKIKSTSRWSVKVKLTTSLTQLSGRQRCLHSVGSERSLQTADLRCTPAPHPTPKEAGCILPLPHHLASLDKGGGSTKQFKVEIKVRVTLDDITHLPPHGTLKVGF